MAKAKTKSKSKPKPAPKAAPKAKSKAKSKATSKSKSKKSAPKIKPKLKAKAKAASVAKPAAKKAAAKKPASTQAPKAKPSQSNISSVFSPLDDRLIVEAVEAATRTAGGLYIPDTVEAGDRPQQGKVLAVGRGHKSKKGRIRPLDVQLGDTVLFESYLATPFKIDERDCVILRESQLLGVVKS